MHSFVDGLQMHGFNTDITFKIYIYVGFFCEFSFFSLLLGISQHICVFGDSKFFCLMCKCKYRKKLGLTVTAETIKLNLVHYKMAIKKKIIQIHQERLQVLISIYDANYLSNIGVIGLVFDRILIYKTAIAEENQLYFTKYHCQNQNLTQNKQYNMEPSTLLS